MNTPTSKNPARKNRAVLVAVMGAVCAMIALTYASVPLYRLFCQVTGFGGTTQTAQTLPDHVLGRAVTVRFNADTAPGMPWDFAAPPRGVTLKLGQRGVTAFTARNRDAGPVSGTALYNVTPDKAGKYFHKMQCFCFQEQTLRPGEKVNMPVVFFIDPALADDPQMDDVDTITLSYTFFRADSPALERGLEGFYNR